MRTTAAKRRTGVLFGLVVLLGLIGIPVWAGASKSDVLVVTKPSSADATIWSLARETLGRVDEEAVGLLANEEVFADLAVSHKELTDAVNKGQTGISYIKLSGVSLDLAQAFESGNLPQSSLFSAARQVKPVTEKEAKNLKIPQVTVTRNMADHKGLSLLMSVLNKNINDLSAEDLSAARGNLGKYLTALPNEKLAEMASRGEKLGADAQLELDKRAAANLPNMMDQKNGQVDEDLLCTIPWSPENQILCAGLPFLTRLSAAYKAEFGEDIPILDGYRPLSEQFTVYYRDPNWTAIPGTSNHGWGMAVDLGWDTFREWDAPEVQWMLENGYKYGWRLPMALSEDSDRPEPWHYEFGTTYTGVDSEDFFGPTPEVIFKAPLPEPTPADRNG
jgi:D-alanyl-D-alanine carboxypeptidase